MATRKLRDFSLVRWAAALWHSPTATAWSSYTVQSLRLLLFTPLLLNRFEAPEIAAWYLFGGLMFVGDAINARIGATIMRMIAFAAGGATNLSPLTSAVASSNKESGPNIALVVRTFGVVGFLNLIVTILSAGVAIALALYGLPEILSQAQSPTNIYAALAILIASKCFSDVMQRYSLATLALNHVALVNRTDAVFSVLSLAVGVLALKAGANIWQLALAVESVMVLRSLWLRSLARRVDQGILKHARGYVWDAEIFRWARGPLFKGLAINFANVGSAQIASIVYARHGPVESTAALLLTMRLLGAVQQISSAPFNSYQPFLSRLMAQGRADEFRQMCLSRISQSQMLFAVGIVALATTGGWLLGFVRSNASLLTPLQTILVGTGMLLTVYINQTWTVMAAGNHIVCFRRFFAAALLSVVSAFVLVPRYGVTGYLCATFLPQLLFLNWTTLSMAADRLTISPMHFFTRTALLSVGICFLAIGLLLLIRL